MTVNFSANNFYNNFLEKAGVTIPKANIQENQNNTPSVYVGDIKDSANKRKLFGIIGASAGSVLLLGIIVFFTISKGFAGSIGKKFKHISDKAKRQIYDLTSESKNLTNKQKIQLRFSKFIKNIADTMQASSNISAVKDSFVQHNINKLHVEKVINKTNQVFKSIVLKTKNDAYQSAEYSVVEFCNYINAIAEKSPKLASSANLKLLSDKILKLYTQSFSSIKHISRANEFWEKTNGLDIEVYNTLFKPKEGVFKNLKRFRSYITTDLITKRRDKLVSPINNAKREISNSLSDVNLEIKQALFGLKTIIDAKNNRAVSLVKEITEILKSNKAINGISEQKSREQLFAKLKLKLDELSVVAREMPISKDVEKITQEKINSFKNLLEIDSYKKGLAQEAITEIKRMFELQGGKDSIEYKQALKLMKKMNKNLNTAIECEYIAYEKLAELQVGSAPTDILGILVPTTIGTVMVVNADDKHERISSTLTKGIPILGGVGVSYYGTTRGFTGFKNLAVSLVTGYLLNILGKETDKFVKNHMKEQEKLKKAFEAFTKMQKTNTKSEKQVKANNSTK